MKYLLAALPLVVLASPVFSQDDTGAAARGAACSVIEDSLQRLTCFDKAFPKGGALAEAAAAPASSSSAEAASTADTSAGDEPWHVEVSKSAIDDSPKVTAYIMPDDAAGTFQVEPKGLALRCIENKTDVVVSTDDMSFGQETGKVTVRLDDQPATTSIWDMADDGRSVGLWNGSTAIPFMRQLRTAHKLAIRVQMRKQTDLVFSDLGNVADVVDQVAKACKWPATK